MSNGLQKGFRWNSEVKGNSYTESGIFVIGVNSREKWRLWKKGEINLWKEVGTDVKKCQACTVIENSPGYSRDEDIEDLFRSNEAG